VTLTTTARVMATEHAADRLAEFYHGAGLMEVVAEVARGVEVDPVTAAAMVGRRAARTASRYVLHRERTGLFALTQYGTVRTFMRFYALEQHQMACLLYPDGDPVTTTRPSWARATARIEVDEPPAMVEGGLLGPVKISVSEGLRDRVGRTKDELVELARQHLDELPLAAGKVRKLVIDGTRAKLKNTGTQYRLSVNTNGGR
jgi:hypothetical protein